jgi:hypothetical protein
VHSALQSRQIKGDITFVEVCAELKARCEANRANDIIDRPVSNKAVKIGVAQVQSAVAQVQSVSSLGDADLTPEQIYAFISTMAKKHNTVSDETKGNRKSKGPKPSLPCLAKDCAEQTQFPLCGTHYHSLVAAKIQALELREQYGSASFDASTKMIVYPSQVPASRLPSNIRRVKAAAASRSNDE